MQLHAASGIEETVDRGDNDPSAEDCDVGITAVDPGVSETAELIARLASRLMQQEILLRRERARSAALELRLARLARDA